MMPVTWLKAKYAAQRSVGRNKSKHTDGARRRATPKRKLNDRQRAAVQANQPRVTLVIGPTGKRTFVREYPGAET